MSGNEAETMKEVNTLKETIMKMLLAVIFIVPLLFACSVNKETGQKEFDQAKAKRMAESALFIWANTTVEGKEANMCFESAVALNDSFTSDDPMDVFDANAVFLINCKPYLKQIREVGG